MVAKDGTIDAFIEIPAGSTHKYEYDTDLGVFRLSRVLFPSVHYPINYGLVPGTRAGDGDRLDILVLTEEPLLRGTLVTVRPVAVLRMSDGEGKDEKILSVPEDDPHYETVRGSKDLPPNHLQEIELFFRLYRLPDHEDEVQIDGWGPSEEAWKIIRDATTMAVERDEIFRRGGSTGS